jgi:hypothetical protein
MPDLEHKPYLPTANPDTLRLIQRAAEHNDALDATGAAHGFATPQSLGPTELLRTAIAAIVCGMEIRDWDCVAQGLVMVLQAELFARQIEAKIKVRVK